jgi:hypothetical protein
VPDDGDTLSSPETLDGREADQRTAAPLAVSVTVVENGATTVIDEGDAERVPPGAVGGGLALVVAGPGDDAGADGLVLAGDVFVPTLGVEDGARLCRSTTGATALLGAPDTLADGLFARDAVVADAPDVVPGLLAAADVAGGVPPPAEIAITATTAAATATAAPPASHGPRRRPWPPAGSGFGKPVFPNAPARFSMPARSSDASGS